MDGTTLLVLEAHDRCWLVAKIDDRKAGRIQAPRSAVFMVSKLETAVTRAKCQRSTPGKGGVSSLDRAAAAVDRFRITVDAARITTQIGTHALARFHAIPATRNDRAHLGKT